MWWWGTSAKHNFGASQGDTAVSIQFFHSFPLSLLNMFDPTEALKVDNTNHTARSEATSPLGLQQAIASKQTDKQ